MSVKLLCVVLIATIDGCTQAKAPDEPKRISYSADRFAPLSDPGLAIDRMTGQICRTWDWGYKNSKVVPSADLQNRPLCIYLFNKYLSSGDEKVAEMKSATIKKIESESNK